MTSVTLLVILGGHGTAAAVRGTAWLMGSSAGQGLVALVALALAASTVRWGPGLRDSWRRGSAGRKELLSEFGSQATAFLQRLERAEAVWQGAERGDAGRSLTHRVATVLASAAAPMTRTELVSALGMPDHQQGMDQLGRVHSRSRPSSRRQTIAGSSAAKASTSAASSCDAVIGCALVPGACARFLRGQTYLTVRDRARKSSLVIPRTDGNCPIAWL